MPLKFIMKLTFVMTIFVGLTNGFADEGGANGGGGGLINENGKLKTLPEAGIILGKLDDHIPKTYPEYYPIDDKTKVALAKIVNLFPFSDDFNANFIMQVLAKKNSFLKLDSINDSEYKTILADYSETLKKHGFKLDEARFALGAISKEGKTYILPVFDKLIEEQRALILIHEYFMREYAKDSGLPTGVFTREALLPLVLYLDGQVFTLLQSKKLSVPFISLNKITSKFDVISFIRAMLDLKYNGKLWENEKQYALISELQKRLGRALRWSDFINNPGSIGFHANCNKFGGCITDYGGSELVDLSLVQMITHDPIVIQYFENTSLEALNMYHFTNHSSGDSAVTYEEIEEFCDQNGVFKKDIYKSPWDKLIVPTRKIQGKRMLFATDCKYNPLILGGHEGISIVPFIFR